MQSSHTKRAQRMNVGFRSNAQASWHTQQVDTLDLLYNAILAREVRTTHEGWLLVHGTSFLAHTASRRTALLNLIQLLEATLFHCLTRVRTCTCARSKDSQNSTSSISHYCSKALCFSLTTTRNRTHTCARVDPMQMKCLTISLLSPSTVSSCHLY